MIGHQDRLWIKSTPLKQMIAACLESRPNEACGFLSGRDGIVTAHHAVPNVSHNAENEFVMHPKTQAEVVRNTHLNGQSILAIYHSHPSTGPVPSVIDIERAPDGGLYYVIVGLAHARVPAVAGLGSEYRGAEVKVYRYILETRKAIGVEWSIYPQEKGDLRRFPL